MTTVSAGLLLILGAYKNRQVFGAQGFVTETIQSGNFGGQIDKAPTIDAEAGKAIGSVAAYGAAMAEIQMRNPSLANQISQQVAVVRDGGDSSKLKALLTLADQQGMQSQADVIRAFVGV
jgi:hypothetical protein